MNEGLVAGASARGSRPVQIPNCLRRTDADLFVGAVISRCLVVIDCSRQCCRNQIMEELMCCKRVLLPLLSRNF